jgi:hypothetical protein
MPDMNASFEKFLRNLGIPPEIATNISQARKLIQDHLRVGLTTFSETEAGGKMRIVPRFFVQGSWAYKTVNMLHHPPQHVDFDLGTYLPVSYLEGKRPSIASREFFKKVDSLLGELAEKNKWKLDHSKKTCTRVILSNQIHFDVQLYSIPDEDFKGLAIAAQKRGLVKEAARFDDAMIDSSPDLWEELPSDRVMLALRGGDWKESDPRKLHRWFLAEVAAKGEQLRAVCRYLKAWRDHWSNDGPASIFLMVLCVKIFKPVAGRDDLAFLEVLRLIPNALLSPVLNPVDLSENLTQGQKPEELIQLNQEAQRFCRDLANAIGSTDKSGLANQSLVQHLGQRFPVPEPPLVQTKPRDVSSSLTPAQKADLVRKEAQTKPLTRPWCKKRD